MLYTKFNMTCLGFWCWVTLFCTNYVFHVMLPCQNSETQIFCLDFRWPGILGVRISETQMFFRNLLLPTFWVSEFRKPKCVFAIFYYPYFGCSNFGNPNIFDQNFHFLWYSRNYLLPRFWVSEFRKPKCIFAIFYYPYFGCPNFGNPNLRPNPLVMLCCYYHIPHKMRQTIEIKISSTVSRNFGRIVRKSKKLHTNYPNIVKTCRNWIGGNF